MSDVPEKVCQSVPFQTVLCQAEGPDRSAAGLYADRQHHGRGLVIGAVKTFFNHPIAVIQEQSLADRYDRHGAVEIQIAFCKQCMDKCAILRDGPPEHPIGKAIGGRLHIQRQQIPLLFIDPENLQYRRCEIFHD